MAPHPAYTIFMCEVNVMNRSNQNQEQRRYWIGVVSGAHVRYGEEGGFAQLSFMAVSLISPDLTLPSV